MTDRPKTWADRLAARAMGTAPADPETAGAEQAAARRASRPPAPGWVQRLAERALGTEEPDTSTTPPAA